MLPLPIPTHLAHRITEQARRTPQATALVCGESRLNGRLCGRWGLLLPASYRRALRRGQVGELQIHRLDRHCPVLLPVKSFPL